MTITPFLILIFAGYAAFMLALGVVWARAYLEWARAPRAGSE